MPASESKFARSRSAGRPPRSAKQSAEMRLRVIEVARQLFEQQGFEAVSMRRIAAVAGCAPMTLYGYFRSKNEILRYVWEGIFAELFVLVRAAARRGTPATRLRSASKAYLDYWLKHPDRYRAVFFNEDQTSDDERYYVDASPVVERFEIFRELITAAQAADQAWPQDPQILGETLVCGLHGIALAAITIPEYSWTSAEKMLDQLLRVVLRPQS